MVGAPGHQAGFFVGQVVPKPGFFVVETGFNVEIVAKSMFGGCVGNGGKVWSGGCVGIGGGHEPKIGGLGFTVAGSLSFSPVSCETFPTI